MSIVRCEVCECPIDTDLYDSVELSNDSGHWNGGEAHFHCIEDEVCPECCEHRPDDARVKNGMRCGICAYGHGEPMSLAPATCADAEEANTNIKGE